MLLHVDDLHITFPAQGRAEAVEAVKGVSLEIQRGEMLALVGESGSGKSLTALAIMGLLPASAKVTGNITLAGEAGAKPSDSQSLLTLSEKKLCKLRGNRISMIFQEPMTALNPLHTIGRQIGEVLRLHGKNPGKSKQEHAAQIESVLEKVGLKKLAHRLDAYPHQLSGGERQRVMIAMAIACEPELLIADEPTTAVDVTLQAQILALLKKLQREENLSILFITHDLELVEQMAERVAVAQHGQIVEQGETGQLFKQPQHPYTQKLIEAAPDRLPAPELLAEGPALLQLENLQVSFPTRRGFFRGVTAWQDAVRDISLQMKQSATLGVVGESGSGKTTLAMALLQLLAPQARFRGDIIFFSKSGERYCLPTLPRKQMRGLRQELQIVFQDPFGSLNPRMTIHRILEEGLKVHRPDLTAQERRKACAKALEETGLEAAMLDRYPHEFSGGQRQRIAIARAMVLQPRFVVLDEPTSALDRTVQKQIILLLRELQARHATSFLFISHDLRVIRALSQQVIVMRDGQIVEQGETQEIFQNPRQPYTQQLLKAAFLEKMVL
jgi:ABC-type microcin C transport system duplicated ATPase subunit YejF